MFWAICAHLQERKTDILQHMVSCCCGIHVAARQTPAYHNNRKPYAVKYQSYAPEDGQKLRETC